MRVLARIRRYARYLRLLTVDRIAVVGATSSASTTVVIVRPDGIGDFVVWLDSARRLVEYFPDRKTVLIANSLFAELAERTGCFDQVVSVDTRAFASDLSYRFSTVRSVRRLKADIAIYPVTSRTFWVGDALVRATGARERIGSQGDLVLLELWQQRLGRHWYTDLLPFAPGASTEWERNIEFLRELGVEAAQPAVARIPCMTELPSDLRVAAEYFVLFPGAGSPKRRWPARSYASVARAIHEQTGWQMVLGGSHGDVEMAQRIIDRAGLKGSRSLAGKTSVPELVEVIRGARLLIGNETSAVHIAAAVGTPSVCLLGGGHFGRFVPYPKNIEGTSPIPVYRRMDCYGCNWRCTQPHEPGQPTPCISAISVADVIAAVRIVLSERRTNVTKTH